MLKNLKGIYIQYFHVQKYHAHLAIGIPPDRNERVSLRTARPQSYVIQKETNNEETTILQHNMD